MEKKSMVFLEPMSGLWTVWVVPRDHTKDIRTLNVRCKQICERVGTNGRGMWDLEFLLWAYTFVVDFYNGNPEDQSY